MLNTCAYCWACILFNYPYQAYVVIKDAYTVPVPRMTNTHLQWQTGTLSLNSLHQPRAQSGYTHIILLYKFVHLDKQVCTAIHKSIELVGWVVPHSVHGHQVVQLLVSGLLPVPMLQFLCDGLLDCLEGRLGKAVPFLISEIFPKTCMAMTKATTKSASMTNWSR